VIQDVSARFRRRLNSFRGLVVASGAAGFAVHEAVRANADVDDGLAEAAEFFALAIGFGLFTLRAARLDLCVSVTHEANVARSTRISKMTLVIAICGEIAYSEFVTKTHNF
jgi:hypothetical protein